MEGDMQELRLALGHPRPPEREARGVVPLALSRMLDDEERPPAVRPVAARARGELAGALGDAGRAGAVGLHRNQGQRASELLRAALCALTTSMRAFAGSASARARSHSFASRSRPKGKGEEVKTSHRGSIYQRASDRRWVGAVSVDGSRKVIYAPTRVA